MSDANLSTLDILSDDSLRRLDIPVRRELDGVAPNTANTLAQRELNITQSTHRN
ncbi:MAG: hypothetical protein AB8B55_14930 [Mariniblastus sp.]